MTTTYEHRRCSTTETKTTEMTLADAMQRFSKLIGGMRQPLTAFSVSDQREICQERYEDGCAVYAVIAKRFKELGEDV